jgi:hypothetical protein
LVFVGLEMKYGLPQIEQNMRLNMGLEIPHVAHVFVGLEHGIECALFILNTGLPCELA